MFGSDRIHTNVVVTLILARSPQVMRIAELPDVDLSQRRTPIKELVSRTELAFIWIFCKYRSKSGDAVYASS